MENIITDNKMILDYSKKVLKFYQYNLLSKIAKTKKISIDNNENIKGQLIELLKSERKESIVSDNSKIFFMLFTINNLLCQYSGKVNTLYYNFKEINRDGDYKQLFHDFNIRLSKFIKPFYFTKDKRKINYEIILPQNINDKILSMHVKISKLFIKEIDNIELVYNVNQIKKEFRNNEKQYKEKYKKLYIDNDYSMDDYTKSEYELIIFLKCCLKYLKLKDNKKMDEIILIIDEILSDILELLNRG